MNPKPKIGDLWIVHRQDDEDSMEFRFRIVATTTANRKRYWLGAKVDWDSGKIMPSDVHTHWFDSSGEETNDCTFDHGYFLHKKA